MALPHDQARQRFTDARVARLATADAQAAPHLVPVTFAVHEDVVVFAVDHKPKSTLSLKRLSNIRENPRVSLLADEYDEDWTQLWWVRADGVARVVIDAEERHHPLEWLCDKYPQYRERVPAGPVVVVEVQTWRGWSFKP
ncbi:TIGR03668 family PPOX class F420-dependent oxidoreductase [Lentzea chajnantorensis]